MAGTGVRFPVLIDPCPTLPLLGLTMDISGSREAWKYACSPARRGAHGVGYAMPSSPSAIPKTPLDNMRERTGAITVCRRT